MTVTVQDLREKYELFNDDDPTKVVEQFAPGAVYNQLDSGQTATGREQIAGVMAGWKACFDGAQIQNIEIRPAEGMTADVDGAVQCFVVDFVGYGRYVHTLPGMEDVAPARNQDVRLPVGETVWLDENGQFVRVDNAIRVNALK